MCSHASTRYITSHCDANGISVLDITGTDTTCISLGLSKCSFESQLISLCLFVIRPLSASRPSAVAHTILKHIRGLRWGMLAQRSSTPGFLGMISRKASFLFQGSGSLVPIWRRVTSASRNIKSSSYHEFHNSRNGTASRHSLLLMLLLCVVGKLFVSAVLLLTFGWTIV